MYVHSSSANRAWLVSSLRPVSIGTYRRWQNTGHHSLALAATVEIGRRPTTESWRNERSFGCEVRRSGRSSGRGRPLVGRKQCAADTVEHRLDGNMALSLGGEFVMAAEAPSRHGHGLTASNGKNGGIRSHARDGPDESDGKSERTVARPKREQCGGIAAVPLRVRQLVPTM